jgi:hypothetical protein
MLYCPGKTNKNKLFIKRNTVITIYPVRLVKNVLRSFLKSDTISVFFSKLKIFLTITLKDFIFEVEILA